MMMKFLVIENSRKFSYLEDGLTMRKYALGKVQILNGQQYLIIEIKRENKSLLMLILHSFQKIEWTDVIDELLQNLIKDSGVSLKESLAKVEAQGITIKKSKNSKKNYKHRAMLLVKRFT
ncbi:Tn7-like element transposition protein TnsE [Priestia megaterium]|uniref:Tn7-like element transposition protein TnsE n=1 Tax=Priestia megaterium TaxID=1404 RepID=UPI002785A79A|nr:GAF domain-containing protein [Bacillus sp. 1751]